jgi:hypothetical protein
MTEEDGGGSGGQVNVDALHKLLQDQVVPRVRSAWLDPVLPLLSEEELEERRKAKAANQASLVHAADLLLRKLTGTMVRIAAVVAKAAPAERQEGGAGDGGSSREEADQGDPKQKEKQAKETKQQQKKQQQAAQKQLVKSLGCLKTAALGELRRAQQQPPRKEGDQQDEEEGGDEEEEEEGGGGGGDRLQLVAEGFVAQALMLAPLLPLGHHRQQAAVVDAGAAGTAAPGSGAGMIAAAALLETELTASLAAARAARAKEGS